MGNWSKIHFPGSKTKMGHKFNSMFCSKNTWNHGPPVDRPGVWAMPSPPPGQWKVSSRKIWVISPLSTLISWRKQTGNCQNDGIPPEIGCHFIDPKHPQTTRLRMRMMNTTWNNMRYPISRVVFAIFGNLLRGYWSSLNKSISSCEIIPLVGMDVTRAYPKVQEKLCRAPGKGAPLEQFIAKLHPTIPAWFGVRCFGFTTRIPSSRNLWDFSVSQKYPCMEYLNLHLP